jgi:ribosome-binding ATPase YchF (GTP1/OBG family)
LSALPKTSGPLSGALRYEEFSIEKIIHVGYHILGLITFYTVVGKEMRAWTIPRVRRA